MRIRTVLFAVGVLLISASSAGAQSEDEMRARELVAKIRKELRGIDEMLMTLDETSPADVRRRMAEVRRDVDELIDARKSLRKVTEAQARVIEQIDELVRMTKYSRSSSAGSGTQDSQQQNEPQRNRERERDRDPERLQKQGRPRSPQGRSNAEPQSSRPREEPAGRKGRQKQKPPSPKQEVERKDTSGRWGNLPPKVQEIFQNLGPEQFPARYQRLLDQYYRKAAEKKDDE